ncbi:exodeoxyribonuclease VII large subunit [candidate division WOR-1 bacterium RIFOXYA2_FULL_37_7]|nr:MAG: exodeoxyribonuclease VII large subunit [candidate division WOR-1 bacterium RIFOXYA2_FULL_37_7]
MRSAGTITESLKNLLFKAKKKPESAKTSFFGKNKKMEKTFSVSELNNAVKYYLKNLHPDGVWVKGEILGFKADKRYASFLLCEKEEGTNNVLSQVQVMCWGNDFWDITRDLRAVDRTLSLKDGLCVQLKCQLDLWPKAGRFQLIAKEIEPSVTIGELHITRAKIYNELKDLGLHNKNKQLPIPLCPLRIALIASRGSAGFNDFVSEIKSSKYAFGIDFYHAAVQGEMVEKEVVLAFDKIVKRKNDYDVVVIVRGGGAVTDLKWFDNQKIGRAIGECPIPVITGIGHEINLSVTDMVANINFKTPTAVAAFLVNAALQYEMAISQLIDGIYREAWELLGQGKMDLHEIIKDINSEGKFYIESGKRDVSELSENLTNSVSVFLKRAEENFKHYEEKLAIFDPVNTLRLGYSITRSTKGKIIKKIDDVAISERIAVELKDGLIYGEVVEKEVKHGC